MATGAKKYSDFFKVYIPQEHSQRMLIPNAFVNLLKRLQERLPEEVILRDHRSGRDWHVNAHLIGGKLYFDGGWKKFRKENLLKAADFLVFTYDGTNLFKLKLYDESGCEKIKEEEEDSTEEVEIVQENTEEKGKSIEMSEEEELEDEDSEMEGEAEEETKDDSYDYDDDDSDDSDDEEDTETQEKEYHGNMRSHCRASKAPDTNKRATATTSSTKAKDPEHEDYELLCVQPDNPYFISKKNKNGFHNLLHIPGPVIKEFSLRFPEKITLLSCKCQHIPINEAQAYHLSLPQQTLGRRKQVERRGKVNKWKDGRVWIQGWTRFSRKNKIEENNVCICEIVMAEDHMVEMLRVHVR